MVTFAELAKTKKCTIEQGFEAWDQLEDIGTEFLTGYRWKGWEFDTGHPMNGCLESVGWYGKEYLDNDNGNPLLIYEDPVKKDEAKLWPANPPAFFAAVADGGKLVKAQHKSDKTSCRLKTILYRGSTTVSMFYDEKPVDDVFKKVDENTIMGVMCNKELPEPFFFVLERKVKL